MSQQTKHEVRNWDGVDALLKAGRLAIRSHEESQSAWAADCEGGASWPECRMVAELDSERVAEWKCWQIACYGAPDASPDDQWGGPNSWTVCHHDEEFDGSRSDNMDMSVADALAVAFGLSVDQIGDALAERLYDLCREAMPEVLEPDDDLDKLWERADKVCHHVRIVKEWGKVWIVWKDADGERHSYRRDDKGDIPDDDDLEGVGHAVVRSEGCDLCGHYEGIGQAYLDGVDDFDELPDHAFEAEEGRNRPNVRAVGRAAVDGEISEGGTSIPVSVFVEIGRAAVREHAGFTNEDD